MWIPCLRHLFAALASWVCMTNELLFAAGSSYYLELLVVVLGFDVFDQLFCNVVGGYFVG